MSGETKEFNIDKIQEEFNIKPKGKRYEDVSRQVLEAMRDGNHDAYRKVYSLYYEPVLNFVFSMVKSRQEAEDITQNIFIYIWEKREAVDPAKSFRRYLYNAARNDIVSHFRKRNVHAKYSDATLLTESGEDFSSEESFIEKETRILIRLAWDQMPPKQKEIFKLNYYDQMSIEQIASKFGISQSAVSSHIHKARKEIRDIIMLFIILIVAK